MHCPGLSVSSILGVCTPLDFVVFNQHHYAGLPSILTRSTLHYSLILLLGSLVGCCFARSDVLSLCRVEIISSAGVCPVRGGCVVTRRRRGTSHAMTADWLICNRRRPGSSIILGICSALASLSPSMFLHQAHGIRWPASLHPLIAALNSFGIGTFVALDFV